MLPKPVKDNVDRLQDRLSTVPRAGTSVRLGLCRRIPAAEAIEPPINSAITAVNPSAYRV